MHRSSAIVTMLTVCFAFGCGGKKGASLPESAYIKDSAKAVVFVDMKKISGSEFGKNPAMEQSMGDFPIKSDDIERMIAAGDPSTFSGTAPAGIVTVKLTASADLDGLKKKFEQMPEKEAGGKKFRAAGDTAVYLDEANRILVMGTEGAVKEALGSGGSSKLLDKVASNMSHAVYLHADLAASRDTLGQAVGAMGPMAAGFQTAIKDLEAVSLTMDVDGSTFLSLTVEAASSEGAKAVNDAISPLIGLAKMGLQGAPAAEGPQKASMDLAKEVLDGTTVEQSGTSVKVNIAMPNNFATRVKEMIPPGFGPGGMGPGGPGKMGPGGPGGAGKAGPGGPGFGPGPGAKK